MFRLTSSIARGLLLGGLLLLASAGIVTSSVSAAIRLGVYSAAQGQVGAPESAETLDAYAAMVGRKPDIVMDYSNITDPLLTATEVSNLHARGQTPLVSWQLFQSGWSGPTISLADIAAGRYDTSLRHAAQQAQQMPFNEILLRFGHEMNGNWYGWSGDPANFVSAWRHVVSVFRTEGATNVKWVWSANVDNGSYPFASYFPGDSWVDYVALDGYNWGTTGQGVNRWQSLEQVFASSYAQLTQMSTKPVIITEVSSSEVGGSKAAWIRQGFLDALPRRFPRVNAVVWYDRHQEDDWRIASSQASLDAYRDVVNSVAYGGTTPLPPAGSFDQVARLAVESLAVKGGKAAGKNRVLTYRLSRRATVRLTLRRGKAKYSVTLRNAPSSGKVKLARFIKRRSLPAGRYTVTATATDGAGQASAPRQIKFKVALR